MKALKILGGIVISLVLLILILGLLAPTENHVERSVMINASMDEVRAKTMSFEGMLSWSPWSERDTNQKVTIKNDGQVGAIYTWDGEDSLVGAGTQTITAMSDNEVVTHLQFTRPFDAEAEAITTLEPQGDQVKVTWSYHDHTSYPLNVVNLLINMDDELGPDFDQGVKKLKRVVERGGVKG